MKHTAAFVFFGLSAVLLLAPLSASSSALDVRAVNADTIRTFSSKHAQRIVSLSPAATETLCSLGAFSQTAARTDYSDYPEEAVSIPSVGGFDGKTLSIEKILSYKPDLVYMTSGMHDYLVPTLRKYGIRIYISDASSVSGVITEITDMGKITGRTKEAAAVTGHIMSVLADVKSRTGTKSAPAVYWEIWKSPYMSVGETSFMNDLINNAGGRNIFSSIDQAYPLVSEESVIARNPAVIIIPDMEHETADSVSHRPGWNIIDAVKNSRITVVNSDVTSRPGPRIADAVLLLAKAIHPELSFDDIH